MISLLDALRRALEEAKKPANPDKCWRCGYLGAHDPYCLEDPANAEWRERINDGLGRWLEREV